MSEKTKMKGWKKAVLIVLSVVCGLGFVLLGAIGYFTIPVASYYQASQKAFMIPGIAEGAVAQGFDYDEESEKFFMTGYFSGKNPAASTVYIIDKKSGSSKAVRLYKEDDTKFTGHVGGIAINNDYVYVASGTGVRVFSKQEMLDAKNGGKVLCKGRFSTRVSDADEVSVSFVSVVDGKLIVGEFHDAKNGYTTPDSHKMTTPNGSRHSALMVEFELNELSQYGIEAKPSKAYSIRDTVQGMTMYDGKFYLSTSYGASFSQIFEYDASKVTLIGDRTVLDCTIPVYALDKQSLSYTYKLPPMAEEIVFVDGKLYTMCESASNKYIFGKLIGGEWCYKTDLAKMKK